jgi:N-methylhydantoinase B/oxoprolinase/acetone carboxylase alpha subunit
LFLMPAVVTMLSERRTVAPWGLAGGGAGAVGINRLLRTDGTVELLPSKFTRRVEAGERLEIETPGGGGWGMADDRVE